MTAAAFCVGAACQGEQQATFGVVARVTSAGRGIGGVAVYLGDDRELGRTDEDGRLRERFQGVVGTEARFTFAPPAGVTIVDPSPTFRLGLDASGAPIPIAFSVRAQGRDRALTMQVDVPGCPGGRLLVEDQALGALDVEGRYSGRVEARPGARIVVELALPESGFDGDVEACAVRCGVEVGTAPLRIAPGCPGHEDLLPLGDLVVEEAPWPEDAVPSDPPAIAEPPWPAPSDPPSRGGGETGKTASRAQLEARLETAVDAARVVPEREAEADRPRAAARKARLVAKRQAARREAERAAAAGSARLEAEREAEAVVARRQAERAAAEEARLEAAAVARREAERKAEAAVRREAESRAQAARLVAEREAEAARREAERKAEAEAARREAEAEAARREAARTAAAEAARREAEQKAAAEAERREAEQKAAAEAARREAEQKAAAEAARREAEQKAAAEAARREAEQKAAAEAARREAEQKAALEAARVEAARQAAEAARQAAETERQAAERAATRRAKATQTADAPLRMEVAEPKTTEGSATGPRACLEEATKRFNAKTNLRRDVGVCLESFPPSSPYFVAARVLRARILSRSGARRAALELLQETLQHPRGRGDLEVYEAMARIEASSRRWAKVRDHLERARGLRPRRGGSQRKAALNLSVAELLATAYRRLAQQAKSAEARRDLRRRAVDAYTRLYDLAEESGHEAQKAEAAKRLEELERRGPSKGLFGGG